jgi:hypothetical protein
MLSPFRGFYDAQSEVDRLFGEMLGGLSRGRGRQGGQQLAQWAPLWTCSPRTGIW